MQRSKFMKIFIHSGTHWDREWYEPFQSFRYRLVGMLTEVIENLLKKPDEVFHLDGQTVVLDDYLEICPEMRENLMRLIKNGQIIIGPWYNMPDEFLLSGESIIKNLRLGMKKAREEYGAEPAKNAYICDIFGHACQTPQIFAGMGLYHTILGRGVNEHTAPPNFRWQSPDGSEVTAYRLRDRSGYLDFTDFANRIPEDVSDEEFDIMVKEYFDGLIEMSGEVPVVVSFDAGDHSGYRYDTDRYLSALRRIYPAAEIYHTGIDEINKAQDEYVSLMPVLKGELAETAKGKGFYKYLISNTLSSRYPIKKYNDINQSLIEKLAAPLYGLRLTKLPAGFLRVANKYLLLNHPHDSICGCSVDQVHRDMMYRFDQTRLICDRVTGSAEELLCGDLSVFAESSVSCDGEVKLLRILNPLPYKTKRNITAEIRFEDDFPRYVNGFGYEKIAAFRLYDSDGNEVPYGISDIKDYNSYIINFDASLGACSVTEYVVKPFDTPTRYLEKMPYTPLSARGEKLEIVFAADGTFTLTDIETGCKYSRLLTLTDEGEIGDGWFHSNPVSDRVTTATEAYISIAENNCNRIVFESVQKMLLPEDMDCTGVKHRSAKTKEFFVKHTVTLAKNDRFVTVETEIDNNVKDHRLKVKFPTGITSPTYFVNQPFGRVERRCGINTATADWKECDVTERQTSGIVYKTDGKRGLAVLSAYGIHECAAAENGDIDLTLFRSFWRTTGEDKPGTDCQLLEKMTFKYQIVPFGAEEDFASLCRRLDFLQCPPLSYNTVGKSYGKYRPIMEIKEPAFVYTTCAPLDNGHTEIRLFNASDETKCGRISLPNFAKEAYLTELDGRKISRLDITDGGIELKLTKWKIATVEIF